MRSIEEEDRFKLLSKIYDIKKSGRETREAIGNLKTEIESMIISIGSCSDPSVVLEIEAEIAKAEDLIRRLT